MLLFFFETFSQKKLPVFENILSKISTGFNEAFEGDTFVVTGIINHLSSVKNSGERYTTYWLAFATFKRATYYIRMDKKIPETKTDQAAGLLEKLEYKNSEDYVCLELFSRFA